MENIRHAVLIPKKFLPFLRISNRLIQIFKYYMLLQWDKMKFRAFQFVMILVFAVWAWVETVLV